MTSSEAQQARSRVAAVTFIAVVAMLFAIPLLSRSVPAQESATAHPAAAEIRIPVEAPGLQSRAALAPGAISAIMTATATSQGPPRARVFELDVDNGRLSDKIWIDRSITIWEVPDYFASAAQPITRALIVSAALLDEVIVPSGRWFSTGGNVEYYALLHVLSHGHALFVVDSSPHEIIVGLGMDKTPAPFDPYGRYLSSYRTDPAAVVTGSALKFHVEEGWHILEMANLPSAVPTKDPSATPSPNDWIRSALSTGPDYDLIRSFVLTFINGDQYYLPKDETLPPIIYSRPPSTSREP